MLKGVTMSAAPIPANEDHRLAVLDNYGILDSPAESVFDEIAFLASLVCDTPISLVSFVDDNRQWFKAKVGLMRSETHRDESFCAHAILDPDEVMVVEDAQADTRFFDSPLVTGEPRIRFYAGAPLVTDGGVALGTLCVIDTQPRILDAERIRALRILADQVMAQLALRSHAAEAEHKLVVAQRQRQQMERRQLEMEASIGRMRQLSHTDELTGLRNRRGLRANLLDACRRTSGEVSVILVDVDTFKAVNDTHGHQAGDRLLTEIARILESEARGSDVVGRLGGDEFLVVCPYTGLVGAQAAAERMRAAVATAGGNATGATISAGIATDQCPVDPDELMALADRALYRAKGLGRNQTVAAVDLADHAGAHSEDLADVRTRLA